MNVLWLIYLVELSRDDLIQIGVEKKPDASHSSQTKPKKDNGTGGPHSVLSFCYHIRSKTFSSLKHLWRSLLTTYVFSMHYLEYRDLYFMESACVRYFHTSWWGIWNRTSECSEQVRFLILYQRVWKSCTKCFPCCNLFILYILRFSHQILLCEKVFRIFLQPITERKQLLLFHVWEICFTSLIGQVKSKTLFHTANLIRKSHYVWNKAISLSSVHFIQIVLPILLYEYKDQALIKLNALYVFFFYQFHFQPLPAILGSTKWC